MAGLINLLSGPGLKPGTTDVRPERLSAGFRVVLGTTAEAGSDGSAIPTQTSASSVARKALLERLGDVRERALANVTTDEMDGPEIEADGLSELVSSLAHAVAEFDQDTGLGLVAALQSGVSPDVAVGVPVEAGLMAIPGTLDGDASAALNDSLQALVAVVGFVERVVRNLASPTGPLSANGGAVSTQGENIPAASIPATMTGKAAGILAGEPPMTADGIGGNQIAGARPQAVAQPGTLTPGENPAQSTVAGQNLTPTGSLNANGGAVSAQGENIPAASIPATMTGKSAGILAGEPPMTADGIGGNQIAGARPQAVTQPGTLTPGENPAQPTVAGQNLTSMVYAATLSEDAVSAGTAFIPEQPRPNTLRAVEAGAIPVMVEPGSVRKAAVVAQTGTSAAQRDRRGGVLRQAGDDVTARSAEPGVIGSRASPAVISDPRLLPYPVGLPAAPDPAPALLGQVVAQAFSVLETNRERGVTLTWDRPIEFNPLSGSESVSRAQLDASKPGLERTAGNSAPDRFRFAAAITAQIRAAEGRTRIELNPRGLGQLDVDIRTEVDGSVKVTIRADNHMVLNALRDAREMLAQSIGAPDGAVLDFQEGSPGQDHRGQGGTPAQGFTGDDEGSVTAAGPGAQSEVIGGGQLDITT